MCAKVYAHKKTLKYGSNVDVKLESSCVIIRRLYNVHPDFRSQSFYIQHKVKIFIGKLLLKFVNGDLWKNVIQR